MIQNNFEIQLPQFEGPFDLLLFFIERDELAIYDIPIAKIADDFLNYILHLNSLNIELASEFILIAATLMRIKAKTLLPRIEIDEEGNEIDLKQDLIQKLILYKKFKAVADEFKILENIRFSKVKRGNIIADINRIPLVQSAEEELFNVDLFKILKVYMRLVNRYELEGKVVKHTIEKYSYTIEEQKKLILQILAINKKVDFSIIVSHSKDKVQFVYNFLAILELLQQEMAVITIGLGFNNFWIERK